MQRTGGKGSLVSRQEVVVPMDQAISVGVYCHEPATATRNATKVTVVTNTPSRIDGWHVALPSNGPPAPETPWSSTTTRVLAIYCAVAAAIGILAVAWKLARYMCT